MIYWDVKIKKQLFEKEKEMYILKTATIYICDPHSPAFRKEKRKIKVNTRSRIDQSMQDMLWNVYDFLACSPAGVDPNGRLGEFVEEIDENGQLVRRWWYQNFRRVKYWHRRNWKKEKPLRSDPWDHILSHQMIKEACVNIVHWFWFPND